MKMALLLQVARRVGPRLHIGRDVPGVWPRILPVAEVLRAALLVRSIAGSVARSEGLNIMGSGGLMRSRIAAVTAGSAVVHEGSCRSVPWIHRLRLPLLTRWLQTAVAASGRILLDVLAWILADLMRLHLRH